MTEMPGQEHNTISLLKKMKQRPFEAAYSVRSKMLRLLEELSIEQLNKIPAGLNNNIIWHIGHILVSTEILCYWRTNIDADYVIPLAEKYKNGTKPEAFIAKEEIETIKNNLLSSLQKIEAAYQQNKFQKITPYATQTFGVMMEDIETVFQYCSLHDTLHLGNITIIKKLI